MTFLGEGGKGTQCKWDFGLRVFAFRGGWEKCEKSSSLFKILNRLPIWEFLSASTIISSLDHITGLALRVERFRNSKWENQLLVN